MFETMGGTADDIAGQDKANPVALIDAAAEMLLHIGGKENIIAAGLIKTAVLEVLAEGFYIGDIKKGPYQEAKGKGKLGTREFAEKIAGKVVELARLREANPGKTTKQIALDRADAAVKPLFERVLPSYEQYARDMEPGSIHWADHVRRNLPPNPVRARSKIVGFEIFVDDPGVQPVFAADGSIDRVASKLDPAVAAAFQEATGIEVGLLFDEGRAGSLQSIRSFGQYSARTLRAYLDAHPEITDSSLGQALAVMELGGVFSPRFSENLLRSGLPGAIKALEYFARESIKLVQSFYIVRAQELEPILKRHGFRLARAMSRGTEIYPTMCDFEKRDVDRYRVEIDPEGKLAQEGTQHALVQSGMMAVQAEIAAKDWIVSEITLNRVFIDGEGPRKGEEISGVTVPYAKDLGTNYSRRPS
jgi:hypothetical protein